MQILAVSMHPGWLSNTYLIADKPGGHAVIVDAGAPAEPIHAAIEEHGLTLEKVLLTHHHVDHVCEASVYRSRYDAEVCVHPGEADLVADTTRQLEGGETLEVGGLTVEPLHIPGHTLGQLAFRIDGQAVFTGDTLFKGSIGGTVGPGHTTFEDIRRSLMDVLLKLPPDTLVYPGHTEATTVAAEWETNPFVRVFRGLDASLDQPCTAFGRPALLRVWASDYDGGHKAWVKFDEGDREAIVPGSGVKRG